MKTIALLMIASCICLFAEDAPKIDPKTAEILNAVISDVLFGAENKSAREFYGTSGDKVVILLDGSGSDNKPVKWPAGFKPEINGFTFVFGLPKEDLESELRDRRLAIRLDRFLIDPPEKPDEETHPFWDKSPIRISIQNGGGTKNGAVIGGQTTWYSIAKKEQSWTVLFAGAID